MIDGDIACKLCQRRRRRATSEQRGEHAQFTFEWASKSKSAVGRRSFFDSFAGSDGRGGGHGHGGAVTARAECATRFSHASKVCTRPRSGKNQGVSKKLGGTNGA